MRLKKIRNFPSHNTRSALLFFAGIASEKGMKEWAELFTRNLPPSQNPRMIEIFTAASSGLPPTPPKSEWKFGIHPNFREVEFRFVLGAQWTLSIRPRAGLEITVERSCPAANDEGKLWVEIGGCTCCADPASDPSFDYILSPTSPERVTYEDLAGFQFEQTDWTSTVFHGCTFDTDYLPHALLEGDARFIDCTGPSGRIINQEENERAINDEYR